jgi:hypothetical protein
LGIPFETIGTVLILAFVGLSFSGENAGPVRMIVGAVIGAIVGILIVTDNVSRLIPFYYFVVVVVVSALVWGAVAILKHN